MVVHKDSMKDMLIPIVEGTEIGRIIIYCNCSREVYEMYDLLEELGTYFTSPPRLPPELVDHCVVDMYCKSTHPNVLQVFCLAIITHTNCRRGLLLCHE